MDKIIQADKSGIKKHHFIELKEKTMVKGDRVAGTTDRTGITGEKQSAQGDLPREEKRALRRIGIDREMKDGSEKSVKNSEMRATEDTYEALLRKIKETPQSVKDEWNRKQMEAARMRLEETERLRAIPDVRRAVERVPEETRRELAVQSIKEMESIKPEKWKTMDESRRKVALQHVGDALRNVYECPDPPLYAKDFEKRDGMIARGYEEDGADIRHLERDYDISINREIILNDDPVKAVETYCHEFRHAYQNEMASRYKKPQFENLVHDLEKAGKWSLNLDDYKPGPTEEMKPGSPEFEKALNEYSEQMVEKDAREFSRDVVRRVYG